MYIHIYLIRVIKKYNETHNINNNTQNENIQNENTQNEDENTQNKDEDTQNEDEYTQNENTQNKDEDTQNENTQNKDEDTQNEDEDNENLNDVFITFIHINHIMLNNLGLIDLVDGNQHDAQEYIMTLLDIINDSHSFTIPQCLDNNLIEMTDKDFNNLDLNKRLSIGLKKNFYNYNKNGYSEIKNYLYFYTSQIIKCNNCNFQSISFQENCMLTIPIPTLKLSNTNYPNTIYTCLDLYFNIEVMENEYKCDKCNEKVSNNKLFKKILNTPNELIIYIKRFNFDIKRMKIEKNNENIVYPNILNISKYTINNKKTIYKLKSILCHVGNLDYGHYYSYVYKTDESNVSKWFKCNDTHINVISDELINNEIYNNNAYMLFYEKIL
jgi:ubiquitin C-terminal hydrolase